MTTWQGKHAAVLLLHDPPPPPPHAPFHQSQLSANTPLYSFCTNCGIDISISREITESGAVIGVLNATTRTRCLRYDNRGYACGCSLTAETGAAPSAPSSNECGSLSSATSSSGVPDVIPARILLHKRSTQLTYHSSFKLFKRERYNQKLASQGLHGTAALKPTAKQNQPKRRSFLDDKANLAIHVRTGGLLLLTRQTNPYTTRTVAAASVVSKFVRLPHLSLWSSVSRKWFVYPIFLEGRGMHVLLFREGSDSRRPMSEP